MNEIFLLLCVCAPQQWLSSLACVCCCWLSIDRTHCRKRIIVGSFLRVKTTVHHPISLFTSLYSSHYGGLVAMQKQRNCFCWGLAHNIDATFTHTTHMHAFSVGSFCLLVPQYLVGFLHGEHDGLCSKAAHPGVYVCTYCNMSSEQLWLASQRRRIINFVFDCWTRNKDCH